MDPIPNNNSAVLNAINNIEQRASTTSASNFSEQNAGYEDRIADETDDRGEEDDEDDDEEDEDDDAEEDEDNGDRQDDHLVELRRQAMIESLIGMGFPVDWALRAAEHCDVSTSESAAISWIIERMELEQSKMDEIEGDSRYYIFKYLNPSTF